MYQNRKKIRQCNIKHPPRPVHREVCIWHIKRGDRECCECARNRPIKQPPLSIVEVKGSG